MMHREYKLDDNAKENIKSAITEILKTKTEVGFAFLHGSFLKERSFHDIDIAVFICEDGIPENLFEYELSLSSILEGRVRLPMDVKILNHAPIAFRYEVTRGEVIFSRDEEARFRFVENTWNEYLDYKPVAEYIIRELAA
ncbi:MAG TPA: nucleotidyltransferase domain-containing protein [Candidatus Methanoperedens sp.]|nr:nucleotidyltransferase domain-containing protein [Candidatus Methanoperedens sp.]